MAGLENYLIKLQDRKGRIQKWVWPFLVGNSLRLFAFDVMEQGIFYIFIEQQSGNRIFVYRADAF